MKIIDRKQLKSFLKNILMQKGAYFFKIMTFKKDRYIEIQYENSIYSIQEVGFEHQVFQSDTAQETLKLILQRAKFEFPRSNKLYISY